MIKAVFDTVVFVRSLLNPHSRWGHIVFQTRHRYRLIVSFPVLQEILEVLQRPELTVKFRPVGELNYEELLNVLALAEAVDVARILPVSRDPADDKFLATAVAAQADYLVTEDNDLLVLKEYQGVNIVSATAFARLLEEDKQ